MASSLKYSEFGLIPLDWELCTFNDVLKTFSSGATPYRAVAEYYKGTIKWVSSGELNYNVIYDTIEHISESALTHTNLKIHSPGTFLMAITGLEAEGTRGRCAIIGSPAATNQSCMAINGTEKLCIEYLFHFYKKWGEYLAFRYCQGTKQQSYTAELVKKLPIIHPSTTKEQKAIAEVLNDIDALIEALNKKIAKKRAIKEGAMQQLLTGKKRLAGFNNPWVDKRAGDIFDVNKGTQINRVSLSNNHNEYPVMNGGMEPSGYIGRYNNDTGTIIISEGGNSCGYVNFMKQNFWAGGHCYVVSPKIEINIKYLYVALKYYESVIMQLRTGSGLPNIQKKRLLDEFEVFIPTNTKEQKAIAQIITEMDDEIWQLESDRQKYAALKRGVMQQLLTGQIRLITESKAQTAGKPQKQANIPFKRSVWAAEIVDRLCDEPTFGHVKMEKMIFLTEHMCGIDIGSNYHRDAAGPYDNRAIRSIDSQLKKQNWFEVVRKDKGYRYIPMTKRGGHKDYFDRYYSDVQTIFDRVINTCRNWNTERCEIVATLYSAWKDLENTKSQYTDDDIINEVINNWNESKKRIPEERWRKALNWMRENDFAPISI